MLNQIHSIIQTVGFGLEVLGVICILVGFLLASMSAAKRLLTRSEAVYDLVRFYRHNLARSVLVGLEFLVAGDIIRTVTGDLTLQGVAILAGIVGIRIVLGLTLEAELRDHPFTFKRSK